MFLEAPHVLNTLDALPHRHAVIVSMLVLSAGWGHTRKRWCGFYLGSVMLAIRRRFFARRIPIVTSSYV